MGSLTRRSTLCLVIGTLAALALGLPAQASAFDTTFKMTFVCQDGAATYPIQDAEVVVETPGASAFQGGPFDFTSDFSGTRSFKTDGIGHLEFRVVSTEEKNVGINLGLENGDVSVRQWPSDSVWTYSLGTNQNDVPVHDFGTITFSNNGNIGSPPCAVFEGARRAFADFTSLVGAKPNVHNVIDVASPAANGQARSVLNKTSLPLGYKVDPTDPARFRNSTHEFAFISRNSLDHLGTYNPGAEHGVCQRTDAQFAYQEGWALYWSNMFAPAPNCTKPKSAANDYRVEGNVAAAFAHMTELCPSIGPAQFATVIGQFPKQIKTFAQFKQKFDQLYTCNLQGALTKPSDLASKGLTTAQMAKAGKKYITTSKTLSKQLSKAVVKTKKPSPCPTVPCQTQVESAVKPGISKVQSDQAALLAKLQSQAFGKAAVVKAAKLTPARATKLANSLDKAYTRALSKTAASDLKQALAALKVYLAKGDPTAQLAATWLKSAIATYKKGKVPLGLALKDPATKVTSGPLTVTKPNPGSGPVTVIKTK